MQPHTTHKSFNLSQRGGNALSWAYIFICATASRSWCSAWI